MAGRTRLLTAEDVLEELELDQDDFIDDESMMPGSDDEFSDLEDVEDDSDDDSDHHSFPDSPPRLKH